MIRISYIFLLVILPVLNTFGQKERKLVREGVKEYRNNNFPEAEVQFRKALDAKPGLFEADYNIANSLYNQKKYGEAAGEYEKLIQSNSNPKQRADLFHNLGNSHLMAQQYEKGIEAYKNSLRIRPEDEDTRYNLAYALEQLKQQQQQQQNDQNNDKEKQDQENKDQQNEQQDNKEDQKKEQQDNQQQNLSKQEAEQMLNAIQNQEKEVKEKADKKKAVARPVGTEKDW